MSTGKKKGLGRGLSALFGDEKPKDKPQEINKSNTVSISDLSRNPNQPRQHFSEQKLDELANSIKKNGVIQPIAVRQSKSDTNKYEIVAGERRWLAAQRAGLHEIPVNILELSDLESLEVAIVENIQRDDLTPIEEARNYFKDKVYKTVIQRNVRLSEAPSHGLPCVIYDKSCVGSKSYFKLAEEFTNNLVSAT